MFTGIVQEVGKVLAANRQNGHLRYTVATTFTDCALGSSVSVDGVCQTVVAADRGELTFEAIGETLARTTLDALAAGQEVNLERAARFGDEIGGHLVSGHVYGTAKIVSIEGERYVLACDPTWMKYFFERGFVALDGISLTLGTISSDRFTVHLIPETLRRTTFGKKRVGDRVNVEIDTQTQILVETCMRREI